MNNARQSSDLPANKTVPEILFADNVLTKNILEKNRDLITTWLKHLV